MNKILISSILVVILLSTSIAIYFVNADTGKKPIASFVDPNKDPWNYVKRYQNEPIYKTWFDKNYGSKYKSIYEAVGLSEPNNATTNTIQTNNQTKSKLPTWIKDKALLFGLGKISENEFLNAIQFLVDNGIINSSSNLKNNTMQIPPLVTIPPVTLPPIISNTPDLDPYARISELKLLLKDCSIHDVKKVNTSELKGNEISEYLKSQAESLQQKMRCNQYNNEIATAIKHQQDLIDKKAEQKWLNSP